MGTVIKTTESQGRRLGFEPLSFGPGELELQPGTVEMERTPVHP